MSINRYQDRPLPPQQEEEEEEDYSSEYSDDYSQDEPNDDRYAQQINPHQQQPKRQQQRNPYNNITPNLQSYNFRQNNRPGYPPVNHYRQGHGNPYQVSYLKDQIKSCALIVKLYFSAALNTATLPLPLTTPPVLRSRRRLFAIPILTTKPSRGPNREHLPPQHLRNTTLTTNITTTKMRAGEVI